MTGISHARDGEPCQDAFCVLQVANISAAALCDGAGSASHSKLGAEATSDLVVAQLVSNFDEFWCSPEANAAKLITTIRERLSALAKNEDVPIKHLACTLAFCAAQLHRSQVRFVCGNLGDGIVLMRQAENLEILLQAENQEFANQTWFVTSTDATERLRIQTGTVSVEQVPGWLLTTDGAASMLYSKRNKRFAPAVMSLLEDLRVNKVGNVKRVLQSVLRDSLAPRTHDDCTIALLQVDSRTRRVQRRAS